MKKAAVLLADGFEEIEALTAVDLLRRARIYVDTVSISDEYMVAGAHGINVQTEDLFGEVDFEEFDMVVLPGGMPGTANLEAHPGVKKVVRAFCEGNMGLLKGKRAICYPSFEEKLSGAVLVKAPVVQDGNIITSRGMGTAIDFGLKLVEVLSDKLKADEVAESIIYLK